METKVLLKKDIYISNAYKKFLDETSEQCKCEWINGNLILQSPATDLHNSINLKLTSLLSSHVNRQNLGHIVFEKSLINFEFAKNNYEPDVVFFIPEKAKHIKDDTTLYNVMPDFIVEIASDGTRSYDRNVKYKMYEKHGVKEYWIIEPFDRTIEKYILNQYQKYVQTGFYKIEDTIESTVIKDFKIRVSALYEKIMYLAQLDKPVSAKYKIILKQAEPVKFPRRSTKGTSKFRRSIKSLLKFIKINKSNRKPYEIHQNPREINQKPLKNIGNP
jgi:Uma2 family endonuclease